MDAQFTDDTRTVIRSLRAGYGVEDIAAKSGISEDRVRSIVMLLRKYDHLREVYPTDNWTQIGDAAKSLIEDVKDRRKE